MHTFKLYTLGCKVNQYESQQIREQLTRGGFKELTNGCPAEVYLINTCTVTQRADNESLQLIRKAHKENPKARIIVAGCLTKLDTDKIRNLGIKSLVNKNKERILSSLGLQTCEPTIKNGISFFKGHTRAFLKIQDGCDNFCAYCKVPLVRGRSHSRPLEEIITEAKRLVKNGFKEIVLTGICLGAYGRDLVPKLNLTEVIKELEITEGLWRIRLSSIELTDISEDLIKQMISSKKLCPHLHIPLQSGDDEVLKSMHRKYKAADYLKTIRKLKRKIPGLAITTDVLVGFPTEKERNFQNTVSLIKRTQPLRTHIFPYSRREGTSAALEFKQSIAYKVIKERLCYLQGIADSCTLEYKKKFLNQKLNVLIESRKKAGFWEGYSDNYIRVLVKSKRNLKNKIIQVSFNRGVFSRKW